MERSAGTDGAVVEIRGVSKRFPGVQALEDVSLGIHPGEIHALAGENGAGKSTLMKLLSQLERPTEGTIEVDGEPVRFRNPRYAQQLGIAMVHQEFALAPHLTVADNLALGREATRAGLIVRGSEKRRARELLERVHLDIDPARRVSTLSVADQQRVEIAKALAVDAKVVIMDEPTATLTEAEIDDLFELIEKLKADGIAIFYISHRLEEVVKIADRVTVMRDGKVVETLRKGDFDESRLVSLMVGREIDDLYPKEKCEIGDVVLRVEGVTRPGILHDCSFEVRAGEIVGFAGLIGAGRTELARAVFAADPITEGRTQLDGKELKLTSPSEAIAAGIGYLTEDRKGDGLAMQLSVEYNITLARIPGPGIWIDRGHEHEAAEARVNELDIRTPSLRTPVEALSGGTQQKVVVARWLETDARVLFFDEPTRGIDVGAKAELFKVMGRLAADGKAIVLISSYLPELINMCDRIVVLRDGRTVGEMSRNEFDEERIMALASGVEREAA
ncbi:MAG: sugar ABC transporter ATP-binding protein [Solirubrobacterales bacterium]|nr:sugar ABC transporter ATP-binding protein [Solirubrobacterales bacterium]